jgi:hypothetical protein
LTYGFTATTFTRRHIDPTTVPEHMKNTQKQDSACQPFIAKEKKMSVIMKIKTNSA